MLRFVALVALAWACCTLLPSALAAGPEASASSAVASHTCSASCHTAALLAAFVAASEDQVVVQPWPEGVLL